MAKMSLRNASPGPRIVHVKVGDAITPVTILPGETRANLELANPDEPVFKAMMDSGELEKGGGEEEPVVRAMSTNRDDPAGEQAVHYAGLDVDRLTPPQQLASDGGPEQMPTTNEQGGALTPQQEEAGGRKEPPTLQASKPSVPEPPEQKAEQRRGGRPPRKE